MGAVSLSNQIKAVVAARDFGRATAARRGRNPRLPWVPVIDHGEQRIGRDRTRTEQVMAVAFTERGEAVAWAQGVIDLRRRSLIERLAEPRHRALREQYGLPGEL